MFRLKTPALVRKLSAAGHHQIFGTLRPSRILALPTYSSSMQVSIASVPVHEWLFRRPVFTLAAIEFTIHAKTSWKGIAMGNPFVHVELNTTDVNKAKNFYGKLFNWELEDMPDGSYTMIKVGNGTGGGMMKHPVPGAPSMWLAYVDVEDINAATQKAKALGASVMKDVTEVMGFGWLSIIVDPTGAMLGLWKAK